MGTLVCRIELNKESGVTVTVENADDKITQTFHLDGTAITTTVKGDETSTIKQDQKSVTITCKDFKVDAETITCSSEKATKFTSKDIFSVDSTKDTKITSEAKLVQKATQDASLEGMNVKIKATTDAKIDGLNVKAKGSVEASLEGVQLKLKGTAKAELAGAMVDVKGDGMATVDSPLTQIKGQLLKLQGTMNMVG